VRTRQGNAAVEGAGLPNKGVEGVALAAPAVLSETSVEGVGFSPAGRLQYSHVYHYEPVVSAATPSLALRYN
jgi:hypothetical protein